MLTWIQSILNGHAQKFRNLIITVKLLQPLAELSKRAVDEIGEPISKDEIEIDLPSPILSPQPGCSKNVARMTTEKVKQGMMMLKR